MSKHYIKKTHQVYENCEKCRNNTTKKCKLKDYIKYSGAYIGKCKN